jgi:formylglycine-generating enzyme
MQLIVLASAVLLIGLGCDGRSSAVDSTAVWPGEAGGAGLGGSNGGTGGPGGAAGSGATAVAGGGGDSSGQGGNSTGGVAGGEVLPQQVLIPAQIPFTMDDTEVAVGAYRAFLFSNPDPASQIAYCLWNETFEPDEWSPTEIHPVVWVDWCDAYAFCAWRGSKLCGDSSGGHGKFDQPAGVTERWFLACTGASESVYPYGDAYQYGTCNAGNDIEPSVAPVKSFPGCEGGYPDLFDMAGNVAEWTDSCDGTQGAGNICHVRGGSAFFSDSAQYTRCADSPTEVRSYRARWLGFRCCTEVP